MSNSTNILGIGTARPAFSYDQEQLSGVYQQALLKSGADTSTLRRVRSVFRLSRVASRSFVLPDFSASDRAELYVDGVFPSTGERMQAFARHAPVLAEEACRKAIEMSGVPPERISHLVIATCTGVGAPDLDVEIAMRIGLPSSIERTMIVWMSCTGAFPALRVARRAVSETPGSVALVVCVELCSLHVRPDPDPGSLLAHALFADGAGALVVASGNGMGDSIASLGTGASQLIPEGRDLLRWEFGDAGFRAHLDFELPELLACTIKPFVERLGCDAPQSMTSWCVHPGGVAILDTVQRALELADDRIKSSHQILRALGNMSSSTIVYVLEKELRRMDAGESGVMLGFGTGVTVEGLRFERGRVAI